MPTLSDTPEQIQQAASGKSARKLVLAGWAAKGIVYVALSWLVLQMAYGTNSEEASTTGALKLLAEKTGGRIAMLILGCGLIAFAIGRILEVSTLGRNSIGIKDRLMAAALTIIYTSLALTAFRLATNNGSRGSSDAEQKGSAALLGLPGGQALVALAGAAILSYGLYEMYKGIKKRFLGTLRTHEMSPRMRTATTRIGTAAYLAKGFIVALLGFFLLKSAASYDPEQAKGLDAALGSIAGESWGQALLSLVAAGLLCYGTFALIEARWRRIGVSASGTT